MKFSLIIIFAIVEIIGCIFSQSAFSQSFSVQGFQSFIANPQPFNRNEWGPRGIELRGSFGFQLIDTESSPVSSNMSAQIDLNLDENAVIFLRISMHLNERIDLSGDFEVGGENVSISGNISFDSTLDFLDDDQITIELSSGQDRFLTGSDFSKGLGRSDQTQIEGTYSFSGPTEMIEGTFSINPEWNRQGSVELDTIDYPNGMSFMGSPGAWMMTGDDLEMFSEMIDGVEISMDFSSVWFRNPDDLDFTPQIIPEPSYAFFGGICLIAFLMFRRR